jgi:phosphoserine phosphatase
MTLLLTLVSKRSGGARDLGMHAPGAVGQPVSHDGPNWSVCERTIDDGAKAELAEYLTAESPAAKVDWAVTGREYRKKRLLISDMDSTIIGQECLDELADFAGLKAEVAEITERAMRGELDFESALVTRVSMLRGLELSALQMCYSARVSLNPGARTLVATMKANGARAVLVSGGFRFFTERVAKAAGFDAERANTLTNDGKVLTGDVGRPILGREAKLAALQEETQALGVAITDSVALGDGANDLAMIRASGLGIAYHAKPIVAAETLARIEHTNLTAALFFQGYREDELVGA